MAGYYPDSLYNCIKITFNYYCLIPLVKYIIEGKFNDTLVIQPFQRAKEVVEHESDNCTVCYWSTGDGYKDSGKEPGGNRN